MLEQEPMWMRDRVVSACSEGCPEPLNPFMTETKARQFARELRSRLDGAADEEMLAELDAHMQAGRWLAAIGVSASLCLRAGVRVPMTIVDFEEVVSCDVHDAILDDIEDVTLFKFIEPRRSAGQA